MNDVIIRCRGISKRFDSVQAVSGVDLDVVQGDVLSLVGPSGCGKTTMLRLIAGFETPDAGTIEIGGKPMVDPRHRVPPEKRRVGMVFQDYALFPHLTVEQNTAFGLNHLRPEERVRVVAGVLDTVGLGGMNRRYPYELSGGQQQRVALARALAPQPAVILLDEPFSNIDATLRARVRSDVRDILSRANATAVIVTHDQEEALSIADKVAVMWEGRILQMDTPERVYHAPATREVAQFLGDMDDVPGVADQCTVECEFGRLRCQKEAAGPVDVFIRPEIVRLVPNAGGQTEILRREFFGHDQRYALRLPSGRIIRARAGADEDYQPGTRVDVEIMGPVIVFPSSAHTKQTNPAPVSSP